MPVRLSEIIAERKRVTLDFSGHEINVVYRPNVVTLETFVALSEMAQSEDASALDGMIDLYCDWFVEWDLLDENDEAIPITGETVARMPFKLLQAIGNAIRLEMDEDGTEKKPSKRISAAGSRRAEQTETARTGTHPSEPRDTWASRRGR